MKNGPLCLLYMKNRPLYLLYFGHILSAKISFLFRCHFMYHFPRAKMVHKMVALSLSNVSRDVAPLSVVDVCSKAGHFLGPRYPSYLGPIFGPYLFRF